MIIRYAISCPGCEEEILVRLSVYPCDGVRFYFPCPTCKIPITGSMRGEQDIEALRVQFDDCKEIKVDSKKNYTSVVTVAPDIPLKLTARNLMEVGGAPSAMILRIAGANTELVLRRLSMFHQARSALWPKVRRFYEYYMQEQWDRFAIAGKVAVDAEFIDPGTVHGRESEAYRALSTCTLASVTEPFGEMLDEVISHMEAIFESTAFREFAVESVSSGALQHEQRRIWDCVCLLMKISEMWLLPGILWDLADEDSAVSLEELSLSRDEFHRLRDAYISCFEACCKALAYVMAFINTSIRGTPQEFPPDVPSALRAHGRQTPPRSFAQFKRFSNFEKLAYVHEWPILGNGLNQILNSKLRNSLGHNSVRHDLRTDSIVTDDEVLMSYFEFTATVYRLNTALHILMNILHSVRMASTEPQRRRPTPEVGAEAATPARMEQARDRLHKLNSLDER